MSVFNDIGTRLEGGLNNHSRRIIHNGTIIRVALSRVAFVKGRDGER